MHLGCRHVSGAVLLVAASQQRCAGACCHAISAGPAAAGTLWALAGSSSPYPPLLPASPASPQRARELLSEGDQGGGGSGIKILLAALAAAPGLQTLLADAVVHRYAVLC